MSSIEKPLSSIQRSKYDPSSKRHGLFGRTGRRRYDNGRKQATLERTQEAVVTGSAGSQGLSKPYVLTAFELAGLDVHHSFDRDQAWIGMRETLAEQSLELPSTRRAAEGMSVTTATLRGELTLLPDPKTAAAANELNHRIYTVVGDGASARVGGRRKSWRYRVRGLKLFAELPPQAPEALYATAQRGATPRLLQARLHCPTCRVPQNAIVRTNVPAAAFSVQAARGRHLNIDLGRSCNVRAVSTQGRHPPTRQYPHVAKDARDGSWAVEGQPQWDPKERYNGPKFTVLLTEHDREAHRQRPYMMPQWVSRFELLWRTDGGREWFSLGTFDGNSDATTEVAQMIERTAHRGGLVCRYLRIFPLDCHGGGAMRVGVYGEPTNEVPIAGRRRGGGAATSGRGRVRSGAADDEEAITYTITAPTEAYNRQFCLDGSEHKGCRCSYCMGDPISRSAGRLQRRLAAVTGVSEVKSELGNLFVAGWHDHECI